jgi:hypothetical protein
MDLSFVFGSHRYINLDFLVFNAIFSNILSPIRRGFAPVFVNYKQECTRLATASDRVYQLLAHGRWFSLGTPALTTMLPITTNVMSLNPANGEVY